MPNARQTSLIASPASSRATNRRRSSITEHSFHGIQASPGKGKGVTHVSGTICHLCLGPLTVSRPGVMICGQDVGEVTACSSSSAVCPDGDDPLAHRIGNPLLIGPAVAGGAQGLDRLGTAATHRDLANVRGAAVA